MDKSHSTAAPANTYSHSLSASLPVPGGPGPLRPLTGLTVLVVEDSRFASEGLRQICQRSGARIRRADTLAHARRHLSVYRPSCILVDIGLPDGDGTALIAELANATPRIAVILGMSGDPGARALALAAGADGFVDKPVQSIAAFQAQVLSHLPSGYGLCGRGRQWRA